MFTYPCSWSMRVEPFLEVAWPLRIGLNREKRETVRMEIGDNSNHSVVLTTGTTYCDHCFQATPRCVLFFILFQPARTRFPKRMHEDRVRETTVTDRLLGTGSVRSLFRLEVVSPKTSLGKTRCSRSLSSTRRPVDARWEPEEGQRERKRKNT